MNSNSKSEQSPERGIDSTLMEKAADEIEVLRRVNELASARLKMFDDCMMLLSINVRSGGMQLGEHTPDIVDRLRKRAQTLFIVERLHPEQKEKEEVGDAVASSYPTQNR